MKPENNFRVHRRNFFAHLIRYFFRGLLFVVPVGISIYFIVRAVQWIDGLIQFNIGFKAPGLGMLMVLAGITLIGVAFSISSALYNLLDELFSRVPVVRMVYTSVKDMTEAFVGEKKKFNEPVAVDWGPEGIQKMGFITQHDLNRIGISDKVAVYFPFSYSLTGQLYLVPSDKIHPIRDNAAEIMKFIVSGGITGLQE